MDEQDDVKGEDHLSGAFACISLPVTGYWLLGSQVNAGIRFCANNLTVGYLDFDLERFTWVVFKILAMKIPVLICE